MTATAETPEDGLPTLTDAAAERLKALSKKAGERQILRLSVIGGGCSGFQYEMALVTSPKPEDLIITHQDAQAAIDPISLEFLKDSVIDFVDDIGGAEFKINNPNAVANCGCGVSFTI